MGLGCDEGGTGVDLDVQSVPKWRSEIADSFGVWRFPNTVAELVKHSIPKRSIAEPSSV